MADIVWIIYEINISIKLKITRIKIQFRRRIQINDLFIVIITIFLAPKVSTVASLFLFSSFFNLRGYIYLHIYISQSVLHNIYFHTSPLHLKHFVHLPTNVSLTYDTYTQTYAYIIHTQNIFIYIYSEINFFDENFNRSRFRRKINRLEIKLKFIINCSVKKDRYFV